MHQSQWARSRHIGRPDAMGPRSHRPRLPGPAMARRSETSSFTPSPIMTDPATRRIQRPAEHDPLTKCGGWLWWADQLAIRRGSCSHTSMEPRSNKICDECGSQFAAEQSKMENLCNECSHILYGYPRCDHEFRNGKCKKCGWNGSRSAYVESLINNGSN